MNIEDLKKLHAIWQTGSDSAAADASNDIMEALPELLERVKRLEEAFSGPAAWLDSWAQHVGNCKGGYVCTCGLTLARTEASRALAALNEVASAQIAGDGWRTMDSAPRDGTRIILAWGGVSVVGYYLDNSKTSHPWQGWQVPSMEPTPRGRVTHWQPLPAPPATAAP